VIRKLYETPRGGNLQNTIPEDLRFERVEIVGNVMEIYFPGSYHEMSPYAEGLFRASLVETMRSLPFINIEGVLILVDGEELIGPFGEPVGVMTDERVLVGVPIMPRRVFEPTITLYFVSADVDGLIPEERIVEHPAGIPIEHVIIEELIAGPAREGDGKISTIPEGTRILGVLTEGGLCSINLSAEFTDNFGGSQTLAELTLQSIVRSIMENQNNVSSIQFLIESERRESFNGVPYFDTLFERDEG
jgi:germination protein M